MRILNGFIVVVMLGVPAAAADGGGATAFVRLAPLPPPTIVAAAEDFPGGRYKPENLLDGNPNTAFASSGKGVGTFVEFDFGRSVVVAGFRHQDRNDIATVAASKLTFLNTDGTEVTSVPVQHVNQRSGVTLFALPEPITARRVRWQVTALGSRHGTVGGAEIGFFTTAEKDSGPRGIGVEAHAVPIVRRNPQGPMQSLNVSIDSPYGTTADVVLHVGGFEPRPLRLTFGSQTCCYDVPALTSKQDLQVRLEYAGETAVAKSFSLKPSRQTTIYILPHSHTDIGYTQLQTEIEDKQVENLIMGMQHAKETADYPPGARFVWNVEVLWAADLYLRRLSPPQQQAFFDAVKAGQVELCGLYLNELTGLCRPEELMRLMRYATTLRERTGVPIETAMISDVPGYTWGTVTALDQAGVKYFSVAPNYFDRIGDILVQWENKPFYWIGPSGKEKVLVWVPYRGYALSHMERKLSAGLIEQFQEQLDEIAYSYDIAYWRWAGHGDNAVPDPAICDFVKDWNAEYEWPRLVISGATAPFRALEQRYGRELPCVKGDWTPFWEDGAGSSALETALNRASSDRLVQAETLWAIQSASTFPASHFEDAWRQVLLYSEHTWGAWCSVTQPLRRETREQWSIKQSYAVTADRESRELLSRSLTLRSEPSEASAVDVFNTLSWPRTGLVILPKHLSEDKNRVVDEDGKPLPSQRLRSGELAFLARRVPPLAASRFFLKDGAPHADEKVAIRSNVLDNGLLHVRLDEETGGIVELIRKGIDRNLADNESGHALNEYLYLIGDDATQVQRNGPVTISVKEHGPLVASLLVESEAPGCFRLEREVRLVAGLDSVELIDLVDKQRLVAPSYRADDGKESISFAFPFNVPQGQMRLDVPYGVIRPDADQIPGACKNWFTLSRWADVSNADCGVTWFSPDAPLVQVGGLTATLLNSQTDPTIWRKHVGPTQQLYAWAMNNHWGTNYRAWQEGPVSFRFQMHPHHGFDAAEAARRAIGISQPLLPTIARGTKAQSTPRLTLDSNDVLVTGMKPSDDGRAIIVRLWAASGKDVSTHISWSEPVPKKVWWSDLGERPIEPLNDAIKLPAWSVRTIRADLPDSP